MRNQHRFVLTLSPSRIFSGRKQSFVAPVSRSAFGCGARYAVWGDIGSFNVCSCLSNLFRKATVAAQYTGGKTEKKTKRTYWSEGNWPPRHGVSHYETLTSNLLNANWHRCDTWGHRLIESTGRSKLYIYKTQNPGASRPTQQVTAVWRCWSAPGYQTCPQYLWVRWKTLRWCRIRKACEAWEHQLQANDKSLLWRAHSCKAKIADTASKQMDHTRCYSKTRRGLCQQCRLCGWHWNMD